MAAGLNDILTAINNLSQAMNGMAKTWLSINGAGSRSGLTAATLLKSGAGRVATVVVTTGGSATGAIYDANATGVTTNPIFTIPAAAGVYQVNFPTNLGIVVVPGTGQTLAVSFS